MNYFKINFRHQKKGFYFAIFFLSILLIGFDNKKEETNDSENNKKPNIIFIYTDDLGVGDVGVFFQNRRKELNDPSKPYHLTPHLDAMANGGAMMEHYSPAPVCAPARASLLLGQSQGHANVRDNQFDKALEDNYTLGNVMQQIGYKTMAIGKWGLQGNNNNWTAIPTERGFDNYYGYMRHGDGHEHYPEEGIYRGKKEVYEDNVAITSGLDKSYSGDLFTAKAKQYIIDHENGENKDDPFFMYLSYATPHAVLELPTQAYPEGYGLNGGLEWLGEDGKMINTASGEPDSWIDPLYANATYDHDNNPNTPEVAWPNIYKRWATIVKRIDHQVQDVIQLLKDLDIDENTLVIFSSDNGPAAESYIPGNPYRPNFFESFGDFDGLKRDVMEGGVRVPGIAYWPGTISPGTKVEKPSIDYDWMPTFTEVAGYKGPVRSDGVSLLPRLTGIEDGNESTIYVEYFQNNRTPGYPEFLGKHRNRERRQMQMLRIGDTLGIRYDIQSPNDEFEIYHITEDPKQSNNLNSASQLSELDKRFKEKITQMRMPNASAPRPYDNVLITSERGKSDQKGWNTQFYNSDTPWICAPENETTTRSETFDLTRMEENSVLFQGFLNVPESGSYTFNLKAEGKAFLRVHEIAALDADYKYDASLKTVSLNLQKGFHPIKLYFKKVDGKTPEIDFTWSMEGNAPEDVSKAISTSFTPTTAEDESKYTETFELIDISTDQVLSDYTYTGDSGYDWTVNGQFMVENDINGSQGISTDNGILLESGTITDGLGAFSVKCKNKGDNGVPHTIKLLVNGNEVGSSTTTSNDEVYTFAVNNINISGNVTLALEIEGEAIAIDNLSWTPYYNYHETFENMALDAWGSETFTGNHGFSWRVIGRGENNQLDTGKNVFFKNNTVGVKSGTISGGISSFSVDCLNLFGVVGGERVIELIINDKVIETFTHSGMDKYRFKVDNIDIDGDFILEIRNASGGGINNDNSIAIDNIKWNPYNLDETTDFTNTETFSNTTGELNQFTTETYNGEYGIEWTINDAKIVTGEFEDSGRQVYFYGGVTGIESGMIPDGISSLTFDLKNKFHVDNERNIEVLVNDKVVGNTTHTGANASTFTVNNLNIEGNFTLAIRNASTIGNNEDAIVINNISWNAYTGSPTTRFFTESFDQLTREGFVNEAFNNLDNGYSWDLFGTISIGDFNQNLKSFIFNRQRIGIKSTNPIPGGIGSFSMDVRNHQEPGNERKIELFINDNMVGSIENSGTGFYQFTVEDINVEGDFTLAVRNSSDIGAQNWINVNNITWTTYSGPGETLGITSSNNAFKDLKMYPNPSNDGSFRLFFPNTQNQEVDVKIYSMTGKEVYNQKHQVTNQKNIDVPSYGLKSGLYIVSIEQNGQSHKLKLIVK